MPMLPYHPAPGFGDLLPGSFVVPQNPIMGASTPLVPSLQAAAGGRVTYRPKIGDLLPGAFPVPQNPLRGVAEGKLPGLSGCGCACGGCAGGEANFYGLSGLAGSFFPDEGQSFTDWVQAPNAFISSVPNWLVFGGAAALAWMLLMPGGSDYRAERRALRSKYRGYRRAAGAIGAYA